MKFSITIDRNEDGMWVAECPAIPGCVSQGRTKDEALTNIREAIRLCMEVRAEKGMPLTVFDGKRRRAQMADLKVYCIWCNEHAFRVDENILNDTPAIYLTCPRCEKVTAVTIQDGGSVSVFPGRQKTARRDGKSTTYRAFVEEDGF